MNRGEGEPPRTALLLAAGKATRLGALRDRWAKACVPVAGRTPLSFLLDALRRAGCERVWVNLHHHGEQVRAHAVEHGAGLELAFLDEPELLGTGGTTLAVAERDGQPPDLVCNAKVFTDFDFASLPRDAAGAVVLHPASSLEVFGGLHVDARGRVSGLRPRGAPAAEARAAVYTGIARPAASWLDGLQRARTARRGEVLCLARDGFLPLATEGRGPVAVRHRGSWCEISTPERVARAEEALRGESGADSDETRLGVP